MQKPEEDHGSSDDAWLLVAQLAKRDGGSNDPLKLVEQLAQSNGSSNDPLNLMQKVEQSNGQSSCECKRSESISLHIKSSTGKISEFVITKMTPLQILMIRYCVKNGFVKDKMRFVFKQRLLHDLQTPDSLVMKNGDVIDAMPFDTYVDDGLASNELEMGFKKFGERDCILIWVQNQWDGKRPQEYSVCKKDGLGKFMNAYGDKHRYLKNNVRFMFKDQQIFPFQSPLSLRMQDGAVIKACEWNETEWRIRFNAYIDSKRNAQEDDNSAAKSNGGSQKSEKDNDAPKSDCFITGVTRTDDHVASIDPQ